MPETAIPSGQRSTDILTQGTIESDHPGLMLHWSLFRSGHFCLTSTTGAVSQTLQLNPNTLHQVRNVLCHAVNTNRNEGIGP